MGVRDMEGFKECQGIEGVITRTKANTQNMKASKDRSEQFMHTTANSTLQPANSTSHLSYLPMTPADPRLPPLRTTTKRRSRIRYANK
jgi:hypothetical protein